MFLVCVAAGCACARSAALRLVFRRIAFMGNWDSWYEHRPNRGFRLIA